MNRDRLEIIMRKYATPYLGIMNMQENTVGGSLTSISAFMLKQRLLEKLVYSKLREFV